MKQPFVKIVRIDTKGLERELSRIAAAIEIAVGLRPAPDNAPAENPADPAVTYSTEGDLLKEEFMRLHGVMVDPDEER